MLKEGVSREKIKKQFNVSDYFIIKNFGYSDKNSKTPTQEEIKYMINLRKDKYKLADIAKITGFCENTVWKHIKDIKVNLKGGQNKLSEKEIQEILDLRKQGLTFEEIVKEVKRSVDVVSKYCKEKGDSSSINRNKVSFVIYNKITNIYYLCDSIKITTILLEMDYKKFKSIYSKKLIRRNKQLESNVAKLDLSDYFFYYNAIKVQHDHLEIFYYNKDYLSNFEFKENGVRYTIRRIR